MPATKPLPKAPSLLSIIGPSFIFLGLGLGSGELIVWPYLAANYGLGIIWAAVVGITLQFFLNMEIERYALVRGESIFVGFWRKWKALPLWFIASTLLPWIWPGIVTSSAKVFATIFGIKNYVPIAIGLLILIGIILSVGSSIYKTLERFQRTAIFISVPLIFGLSLYFANPESVTELIKGFAGIGHNYWLLPAGIPIASLLAGLAYAGAGGNLNLVQSSYIKDKGYGMGKYAKSLKSMFAKKEAIKLTGTTFTPTSAELKKFYAWWRIVNLEHFLIFWLTGGLTIILLCLLAFNTVFGKEGIEQGITFIIMEAGIVGASTFSALGTFFLFVIGIALFACQLGVFEATSRIMSENLSLSFSKLFPSRNLSNYFYFFLWFQILAGIVILSIGFTEPLALIILAATLNAVAMFVFSGLLLWVNKTLLPKAIQPNPLRSGIVAFAFLFYGAFSIYTLVQKLLSL